VVSSFVNWYTDWIGNNTQNFYNMLKALGSKNNKIQEIKRAATSSSAEKKFKDATQGDDGFEKIAELEKQHTVPLDFKIDDLTELQAEVAAETYRPFMLLKAADHILNKHLDSNPPRKYSYKEWCWLMKLLGEDETDESGHRRVGQALPEGVEVVTPVRGNSSQVWSWLGQESPLMSMEEGIKICLVIECHELTFDFRFRA
jgi:potassium channel subfamily K